MFRKDVPWYKWAPEEKRAFLNRGKMNLATKGEENLWWLLHQEDMKRQTAKHNAERDVRYSPNHSSMSDADKKAFIDAKLADFEQGLSRKYEAETPKEPERSWSPSLGAESRERQRKAQGSPTSAYLPETQAYLREKKAREDEESKKSYEEYQLGAQEQAKEYQNEMRKKREADAKARGFSSEQEEQDFLNKARSFGDISHLPYDNHYRKQQREEFEQAHQRASSDSRWDENALSKLRDLELRKKFVYANNPYNPHGSASTITSPESAAPLQPLEQGLEKLREDAEQKRHAEIIKQRLMATSGSQFASSEEQQHHVMPQVLNPIQMMELMQRLQAPRQSMHSPRPRRNIYANILGNFDPSMFHPTDYPEGD